MRPLRGAEIVRKLKRLGFIVARIRGSHHFMVHPTTNRCCCVPVHGAEDVPVPTLHNILKQAGVSEKEILEA